METTNGDELRIILSKENNKEYITLHDSSVLYSDFRSVLRSFDEAKQHKKDVRNMLFIRKYHVFYARMIGRAIGFAAFLSYQYGLWQLFYGAEA
jgi:uncharacterized membrane protein YjjP (DUF1212 family)